MVRFSCSVNDCYNRESIAHRFPHPVKYPEKFKNWIAACNNKELEQLNPTFVYNCRRICHRHFAQEHILGNHKLSIMAYPKLELSGNVGVEKASQIVKVAACDPTLRENDTTNIDLPKVADPVSKVTFKEQNLTNFNLDWDGLSCVGLYEDLADPPEGNVVILSTPPIETSALTGEMTVQECDPKYVISENPNTVRTIDSIQKRLKDERRKYCLTSDNIGTICRACLKEKDVKNMYDNTFDTFAFAELLEMCSTIKLDKDDLLSKHLCDVCIIELVRSYMFRQKCQKSEATLQEFKVELEAANQRRDAVTDLRQKVQLLDHDYEHINDENIVHDLLQLKSNSTENNSTKPKFIKRFYMFKGNINENSLSNIDTNLVEINERKAIKLLKKSSQKFPKIFIGDGKKSDLQIEIANTDLTKENVEDAAKDIENKENTCDESVDSNLSDVQISANAKCQTVKTSRYSRISPEYTEAVRRAIKLVLEGRINEANRLARNRPKRSYRTKPKTKEKKPRIPAEKITFPGKCKVCGEAYETKNEYVKHSRETRHFVKTFPCDKCSKSYPNKYTLVNHLRIHNNEKPFMCEKCGACFRHSAALYSHTKVHSEHKVFACKICNRGYPTLKDLVRHRKTNHSTQRPYCCEYCGLFLVSRGNLSEHKKRIHLKLRPQKCVVCGKGFYSKGALSRHVKVHSSAQYNCKLCNFFCRVKSRLVLHMKCRHPGTDENATEQDEIKLIECFHCDAICQNKQSLSIHLGEVHGILTCKYCDIVFEAEEDLLNHSIVHADVFDNCSCRYCGKTFPDWPSVFVHLAKHKDKNYSCEICHRKYTQSQKLRKHMLIHTNEKPYSCKYCTRCFTYKSSLVIHERVHTGERPYVCDICGKGNVCSSSLKRHKTTHLQND